MSLFFDLLFLTDDLLSAPASLILLLPPATKGLTSNSKMKDFQNTDVMSLQIHAIEGGTMRHSDAAFGDYCLPRRKSFIQPSKANKSVRFSSTCDVTFVERFDVDEIDANELWYSDDEFKTMRYVQARTVRTIQLFVSSPKSPKNNSGANILLMGLENLLMGKEVKECRRRNLNAVLDEQERQDELGVVDPDSLACVSHRYSLVAAKKARELGISHSR